MTGPPRELPSEARLALYRTAQEALTNIRKHAAPERVEIALAYEAGGTRLRIEDHGRGAPVAAGAAGLAGARAAATASPGCASARSCSEAAWRPGRPATASASPVAAGVIRVLLADDQRVVREGLGTLLGLLDGIELVGTAADGEEAVALAGSLRPDVVLMDLRMPRCDGVEATRRLAAAGVRPRVVVLTTYADDASVLEALRAGARGYLTKDAGAEDIRAAIEAVSRGEAALDPAVQHHVVAALSATRGGKGAPGPARGSPTS